ncbi:prolyl-tRNA synthetase associated domain-containing protein [Levilactobacillus acidifarinae]|nr:YbaK/EbsC family protein [Levilactobacillus acidifarinae]GEO68296.1 prolyl-tRNA editing protein proX [Levilactobacillus acidifarinae]
MDKTAIYALLDQQHLWHEITEHSAVSSMAEVTAVELPYPEAEAKNLLVCDDHHHTYYLLTVKGDLRVDLKAFRQQFHTRRLTFASAQDLKTRLGVIPGAVTPLGLLNDDSRRINFFIDQAFLNEPGLIGVHPNDNTATVCLKTTDLLALIRQHGNPVTAVDFSALTK